MVIKFGKEVLFHHLQFSAKLVSELHEVSFGLLHRVVDQFERLVNFCDFLRCDVLVVDAPLGVLLFECSELVLQLLAQLQLLSFQSRHDVIKPPHFSLNDSIDVGDVLEGRFFQINQALL